MIRRVTLITSLVAVVAAASNASTQDPAEIVRSAIDNWRGTSSYGEMSMTIHRPSWERTMSMRSWTSGSKKSLVRVTAPKKDAGNGTLMVDNNMWSYAPKVNRVIKVPSSMMGQSWMGSDFSNKDVSRADDIVEQYDHTLVGREEHEGHAAENDVGAPHGAEGAQHPRVPGLLAEADEDVVDEDDGNRDGEGGGARLVLSSLGKGGAEESEDEASAVAADSEATEPTGGAAPIAAAEPLGAVASPIGAEPEPEMLDGEEENPILPRFQKSEES